MDYVNTLAPLTSHLSSTIILWCVLWCVLLTLTLVMENVLMGDSWDIVNEPTTTVVVDHRAHTLALTVVDSLYREMEARRYAYQQPHFKLPAFMQDWPTWDELQLQYVEYSNEPHALVDAIAHREQDEAHLYNYVNLSWVS